MALRFVAVFCLVVACLPITAQARVWTDASGQYTLEAELVAFSNTTVVLRREDRELVAFPIEKLSDTDREYLKSDEAGEAVRPAKEGMQTWTLKDGTQIVGRIVDYAQREVTLQRRRSRIYVNNRQFENLPEFYQQIVPQIVAAFEELPRADRRSLEAWLVRQRAQPRTFLVEGIVVETESGDEYGVPFVLMSDDDLRLLQPGWERWLEKHGEQNHESQEDLAFLLESLAAARQDDKLVQREIAMMQLQMQAVQAGVTALWEVTLYPAAGQMGPPLWVVVPGRDSNQATFNAMQMNPGYVAGPIRRVSRL